ncbi:2-dehydropantoate 2-reductase [Pseudaquabacterium pictum]|uniref:2-dehydropantoate 2-reductase n=1 Tax=Pseudaquabacterium pictum TaxID=2315236 RepID=A0A480AVY6_9BURK|nr:2-dehydropantoate 2-reductase [Rubrivivax pictus]GCL62958.1 2-dehydropantoate 2-reductase [Rubrivivax pictus]
MKVCIYGVGAIGGFIGARLAAAGGCRVSAVARGDTLAALQQHGLRLRQGGALLTAPVQASDEPATLGVQDLVVIAVKGPALGAVAARIAPLIGPQTLLLPAMNGVPWWFAAGAPALGTAPLASIDPGGHIAAALPLAQVIGCVVHASTFTSAPGLVEHKMGQGLILGEPLGGVSDRVQALAGLLQQAGFDATASADVRRDIWYKLWGNMTMNPLTAITGATVDKVLDDPLTRAFVSRAMAEAATVGAMIGCAIDQTPEDRHQVTRKLGAFKTSMLQDVEAGRPIELDALVTVVQEIAQRVGVTTPNIDALLGLARLHGRMRGLYPEAAPA